jgi:hypothetical protein
MFNPFREKLAAPAFEAHDRPSPFQPVAEAALGNFRAQRAELERQVRRGNLTVKVARERALEAASALRTGLMRDAESFSATPRAFLDRLTEASDARQAARETMSIEGLQRETNRLLRQSLMEQQIVNRAGEFEGRTQQRPITGGTAAPTLDSLLALHRWAQEGGDEVAQEWARRQLEGFRPKVAEPDDLRKIDLACDRPDRVNPRIVRGYLDAMGGRSPEELETFVNQAIDEGDANACVASFALARDCPEGSAARWVRKVLGGIARFPDAALASLRTLEADARAAESQAAKAQAEFAIARAEAEVSLSGLAAPTEADMARLARMESLPVARPGEAIGLALGKRGLMFGDPEAEISLFPEADGPPAV